MNANYATRSISSFNGQPVNVADMYYTDAHTAVPRGDMFSCAAELTIESDVTKTCQLKTGAKTCLFFGINMESNVEKLTLIMSEAPTITDGTTAIPSVNYNRQSGKVAQFVMYADPTNISGGTAIKTLKHYTTPTANKLASISVNSLFHILKPNTSYSIAITNGDNNTKSVFATTIIMEVG